MPEKKSSLSETLANRTASDILLILVVALETARYAVSLSRFDPTQAIYLLQHLIVMFAALTRTRALDVDNRPTTLLVTAVSYAYPYAYLFAWNIAPTSTVSEPTGKILVDASAILSIWAIFCLRSSFGIRPAIRQVVSSGPYRLMRHPIYFSYIVADIGLLMIGFSGYLVFVVTIGWCCTIVRLIREEKLLAQDETWTEYSIAVRHRLIPRVW